MRQRLYPHSRSPHHHRRLGGLSYGAYGGRFYPQGQSVPLHHILQSLLRAIYDPPIVIYLLRLNLTTPQPMSTPTHLSAGGKAHRHAHH